MLDMNKKNRINGSYRKMMVDGEMQGVLNIDGVLNFGLITCISEEGIDILEMIKRGVFNLPFGMSDTLIDTINRIQTCTDTMKIVDNMLTEQDTTIQQLWALRYTQLAVEKSIKPYKNQITVLKQELDKSIQKEKVTNNLYNVSINREKELNAKLNKQSKKHDKEIRVLEHRIQELEKELYGTEKVM